MERSYESVREGVIGIANRWARASRALKEEDRPYGEKLVHCAKMYSCGSFFGCEDPLEAVLFSVLIGMIKRQEDHGGRAEMPGDEHPEEGVLSLKYWT
jgi:hypothetical protein